MTGGLDVTLDATAGTLRLGSFRWSIWRGSVARFEGAE